MRPSRRLVVAWLVLLAVGLLFTLGTWRAFGWFGPARGVLAALLWATGLSWWLVVRRRWL